uniref:Uncharacterized protein n=1 Tax=Acrobeloides nanus TaxID=290746 RepID=A0A914CIF5_9BILA
MDGLGTYKFRNPNAEQLGDQFRWILTKANTMPNASLKNIVDDADFFTYRGLLSTLSTTIYNAKY